MYQYIQYARAWGKNCRLLLARQKSYYPDDFRNMNNASHSTADPRAWVLEILEDQLAATDRHARRLHIPTVDGLMRHTPGKLIHITPEIFLQLEGVNCIAFPHTRLALRPGHTCVIPSGLPHSETHRPVHGRFCMLVFMFRHDHIQYFLCEGTGRRKTHVERHECVESSDSRRIGALLDDLARLAHTKDRWSRYAQEFIGPCIFSYIGRALHNQPKPLPHSSKTSQALYLIATQLENPTLSTAYLARRIACTPGYLSELFHKETGITLVHYIHQERVHKAEHLLKYSEMSIKEISAACGFNNPDYFRRIFIRLHGTPPSRHRLAVCRA